MLRVGECHREGRRSPDAVELAEWLRVPFELVDDAVEALHAERLLVVEAEPAAGYLPGRDIASIRLVDVLEAARRAHDHRELIPDHLSSAPRADALLEELEASAARALGDRTLRDALDQDGRAGAADSAPGAVALKSGVR